MKTSKLLLLFAALFVAVLTIGFAMAADIQVTGVSVSQSNPAVLNQEATIMTSVILRNSSSAVSTDVSVNFGNSQTATRSIVLQPNLVYEVNTKVTYTTTGTFTITATADAANLVAEDVETNNQATTTATIASQTTTLSVSNVNVQGISGQTVSGTSTLRNTGNTDVTATLTVADLTSGSNVLSRTAVSVSGINGPIASNAQIPLTVSVVIPSGQAAGTYSGLITVRANNQDFTGTLTVVVGSPAPTNTVSLTVPDFGSDSQDRLATITRTVRITNTYAQSMNFVLGSTIGSEYKVSFSQSAVTLPSGGSSDVTVSLYVPESQDSGRQTIGQITATSNGQVVVSTDVVLVTATMLEIKKVKIDIDGDEDSVSDGENVEVEPGDEVVLSITVENNFDDNIEIQDIEVSVDQDDDIDWNEDDELSDLSEDDDDVVDFTLEIPSDADRGTYTVDIKVTGEDENGARHEDKLSFDIELDRNSREITVQDMSISPAQISCGGKITITTKVENTGTRDEPKAVLILKNEDLALFNRWIELDIDEDDAVTKTYSFTVDKDTPSGEYLIEARTYYENSRESDTYYESLTVKSCGTTTVPPQGNTNNPSTPAKNSTIVFPPTTTGPYYGETSFYESTAYVIILGAAAIILIMAIIVLLVKFVF